MRKLRAFGAFWWDFIVGDDWLVAVVVVVALAVTALLARVTPGAAWVVLPIVVIALIPVSVRRLSRKR
jgi:hypothetical protein